jgi:histidine triad (HIT) family protein
VGNQCIFCAIVAKEAPVSIVWEGESHLAFLSDRPNTLGFTVVVTRHHYSSYAFSAPSDVYHGLLSASATVARKLDAAFDDVGRTGLILEGFGVDHLHAKLVPLHGTVGEWRTRHSSVDKYFVKYEGFISSHDHLPAPREMLESLAKDIRTAKVIA